MQGFLDLKINLETSNKKFRQITEQLKNRTAENLALGTPTLSQLERPPKENNLTLKEKNAYHEFAHSLMKDGGAQVENK